MNVIILKNRGILRDFQLEREMGISSIILDGWMNGWMDGWMDDLKFYVLFSSISVISERYSF